MSTQLCNSIVSSWQSQTPMCSLHSVFSFIQGSSYHQWSVAAKNRNNSPLYATFVDFKMAACHRELQAIDLLKIPMASPRSCSQWHSVEPQYCSATFTFNFWITMSPPYKFLPVRKDICKSSLIFAPLVTRLSSPAPWKWKAKILSWTTLIFQPR